MHNLPVDDEAHLLFSCPATAVVRRDRQFAQLPFTPLQDLKCCRDMHKCIKIAECIKQGNKLDEVES
jgi:chorismate mutase